MILYRLTCSGDHEFDAWFRNARAYDTQAARGVLSCPQCGDRAIEKAVMAPAIRRGAAERPSRRAPEGSMPEVSTPEGPAAHGAMSVAQGPADLALRALLRAVRAEVERSFDYVGPRFAREARAIHEGEAPERPIYGEASAEEVEVLREDGIAVAQIPWAPRHDA